MPKAPTPSPEKLTDDDRSVLAELHKLQYDTIVSICKHKDDANPAQFVLRPVPMHILNRVLASRVENLRAAVNGLESYGLVCWERCRIGCGRLRVGKRVLVVGERVDGPTSKTWARWEGERAIVYRGSVGDTRGPLAGVTLTASGLVLARQLLGRTGRGSGKVGRPRHSDPKADAALFNDWIKWRDNANNPYPVCAFAKSIGKTEKEVKLALDRHRKRERRRARPVK